MNLPAVLDHISAREGGYRAWRYKDSRDIWTIGIGLNLEDPSAKETCLIHGLNWQALIDGKQSLSYKDAVAIATYQVLQARYSAKRMIPEFDDLPDNAQIVTLDMLFNMGFHKWSLFHDTIGAINDRDFPAAAAHMKASEWYRQVGQRGIIDCELMAAA